MRPIDLAVEDVTLNSPVGSGDGPITEGNKIFDQVFFIKFQNVRNKTRLRLIKNLKCKRFEDKSSTLSCGSYMGIFIHGQESQTLKVI